MDPQLRQEPDALKAQMEAIYASVEKTRKYFLWTLIVTLVVFVLPLILLMFAVPAFIGSYTSALSGLEGY